MTLKKRTQAYTRSAIWAHNSLRGTVAFAIKGLNRVDQSATTTPKAKELAARIQCDLRALDDELKTRIDP